MDLPIRPLTEEERRDMAAIYNIPAVITMSTVWFVNNGAQPVPNGTLVDLVLCGNFDDPVTAAVADHWTWRAGLTQITHWRLHDDF